MTSEEIKIIMNSDKVYIFVGSQQDLLTLLGNDINIRTTNIQGTLYFVIVSPEGFTVPISEKILEVV